MNGLRLMSGVFLWGWGSWEMQEVLGSVGDGNDRWAVIRTKLEPVSAVLGHNGSRLELRPRDLDCSERAHELINSPLIRSTVAYLPLPMLDICNALVEAQDYAVTSNVTQIFKFISALLNGVPDVVKHRWQRLTFHVPNKKLIRERAVGSEILPFEAAEYLNIGEGTLDRIGNLVREALELEGPVPMFGVLRLKDSTLVFNHTFVHSYMDGDTSGVNVTDTKIRMDLREGFAVAINHDLAFRTVNLPFNREMAIEKSTDEPVNADKMLIVGILKEMEA